ncbi:MAG: HAD-IB family phosphatase [Candidatus Roizmanbacteria bacterium]
MIKAVIFDCDGVINTYRTVGECHRKIGLPEDLDISWMRDYYSGKISYKQWEKNLAQFYKSISLNKETYLQYMSQYVINSEAIELISYIKKLGLPMCIISSGFDIYVKKIAQELGIHDWYCNLVVHFNNNNVFQRIDTFDDEVEAKVEQLAMFCSNHFIRMSECLYVGDSENDIGIFRATKHGVLYRSKNKLCKEETWKEVQSLVEIVDILKYEQTGNS